jgi:hypothetical protein
MRSRILTMTTALALVLALPAGARALAPVGGGVVGLWQAAGNADDPFQAHDGTLLGGAGFAPDLAGQAFSFTGSQQAVDIPDAPDLYPSGSFTVAGWVRTTDTEDAQALMGHYECGLFCPTNLANSVFALYVDKGHAEGFIRDTDAGGPPGADDEGQVLVGSAMIADGANHYLAFERDSAAGELRLYVDGALASSAPLNAGATGPLENLDGEPDDLYLGSYRRCNAGGEGCDGLLTNQLRGLLDDAIYWERPVSASEVAAIYAAGPDGLTTDATAPTSLASAPASAPPGPITVSFTASDIPGAGPHVHDPSGIAAVDLYAKAPGDATFAKVASAPGAASGSFAYTATAPGTYGFATVATDLAGNVEGLPALADATTTVTASVAKPAPAPPPQGGQLGLKVSQLVAGLPPTKACVSRRAFTIHVVVPAGVQVLSASVRLNGRQVAVRSGRRLSAPVSLRGLPKGRYALRIVVRLAGGRVVSETRRYHTCIPGHHIHRR